MPFISQITPLIFSLIFFKKIKEKYLKVFFVYTILLALIIITTFYVAVILKSKVAYYVIINISTLFEYCILALFFYYLLKNEILKKVILFSIIPFFIFASYIYFTSHKNVFNLNITIVHFIVFLVILGYYLVERLNNVTEKSFFNTISFRICVGLLVYFAGNLFFLLYTPYIKDIELKNQMKLINAVVSVAKDCILAFAWFGTEPSATDAKIINIPDNLNFDKDFAELRENDRIQQNLKNQ